MGKGRILSREGRATLRKKTAPAKVSEFSPHEVLLSHPTRHGIWSDFVSAVVATEKPNPLHPKGQFAIDAEPIVLDNHPRSYSTINSKDCP